MAASCSCYATDLRRLSTRLPCSLCTYVVIPTVYQVRNADPGSFESLASAPRIFSFGIHCDMLSCCKVHVASTDVTY